MDDPILWLKFSVACLIAAVVLRAVYQIVTATRTGVKAFREHRGRKKGEGRGPA